MLQQVPKAHCVVAGQCFTPVCGRAALRFSIRPLTHMGCSLLLATVDSAAMNTHYKLLFEHLFSILSGLSPEWKAVLF